MTTTPKLCVTLFGGFQVLCDGKDLTNLSPKPDSLWVLFRFLLTNRGKYFTTDALMDALGHEDAAMDPHMEWQSLICSLRKQLPDTDEKGQPYILSQHHAYGWNSEAQVYVDAIEFDGLAAKIKAGLEEDALEPAAQRLIELYAGDYMQDIAHHKWVEGYIAYYRRQYFDCINAYVAFLYERRLYEKVIEVCSMATQHNMFDEHYHAIMINAMLAQGNRYGALTHYKSITALVKKELGAEPSEELKAAGQNINTVPQPQKADINMVLDDLRSTASATGAMFCEMDVFRQIFQLQERKCRREQTSCMLVMYTVVSHNRELDEQETFQVMIALKHACMIALRKTDVLAQPSATQQLLLLPDSNEASISIVLMRIQQKFTQLWQEQGITLTTQARSIHQKV